MTRAGRDAGQAVLVVVGGVALTTALLLSTARFAADLNGESQARIAADAAALAGATGGRGQAEAAASENGASLVSFSGFGTAVIVTVRVGSARATARAIATP